MPSYLESGVCDGCGRSGLSVTGFQQHLRGSQDPLCRALFEARSRAPPPTAASAVSAILKNLEALEPGSVVEAIPFAGDVFGGEDEYEEDDFGQDEGMAEPVPEDSDDEASSFALVDDYDDDDDDEWAAVAEQEGSWEPPAPNVSYSEHSDAQQDGELPVLEDDLWEDFEPVSNSAPYYSNYIASEDRRIAELRAGTKKPVIHRYSDIYPESTAGGVKSRENESAQAADARSASENPYAPFASRMEWEIARWAKLRGPGSTSFTELLNIEGVQKALGLSFGNSGELNKVIDNHLPGRPRFERKEAIIGGEAFEFYCRNILDCVKALWSEPDFADVLIFEPERHYVDEDATIRLFHDMHTGKWWWAKQREVEAEVGPGTTIIPIIIASDKTQLTVFRNKTAYPVYITIGNLPKHIRRKPSRQGHILLAYLPATKLNNITNKAARKRALANLFHQCMGYVLRPLVKAGKEGIDVVSGDGATRRGHPIFAAFVGDYPEQLLAGLIKTGWCPTCPAEKDGSGEAGSALPPRNPEAIVRALNKVKDGPTVFTKACAEAGIRPIQRPFWKDLPFLNIYTTIVPDILHQLHQGVLKHVILWLRSAYGDSEIDARCRRLPPNHNIRLFMKGLSPLSRVTGTEHAQISQILLSLIIGARLPNNLSSSRLIRAVRAILDFIFLAQYPLHSYETLDLLDDALSRFHEDKDIFIDLGIRTHFDFPKLHSTGHYRYYMELFGTTDNYNTAYTERLHIDLAKDAYRSTNRKDEYAQMTAWLDRREKVYQHELRIKRRLEWLDNRAAGVRQVEPDPRPLPTLTLPRVLVMSKHPTVRRVKFSTLQNAYGATNFKAALARYITRLHHPEFTRAQIETAITHFFIPFDGVSIYHRIKFTSRDPTAAEVTNTIVDSIHAQPSRSDRYGKVIPGRFDTAVVVLQEGEHGILGSSVGRIRCIFSLPKAGIEQWFTKKGVPSPGAHFAYVDWFTDFPRAPDRNHGLYRISYLVRNGERLSSIVPVSAIWQSIHLYPEFGASVDRSWKSTDVLDQATHFFVNPFTSRYTYSTIY